jgi:hypothetical protein
VEDFLLEGHLRCPFCHTRLRHLGENYDHPMESLLCNDCGHRFIDANVVVGCFNCGTRSWPDELIVKNIFGFKITDKGKTSARVGTIENIYNIFDSLNYIDPPYFNKLLDWHINLHKRYPSEHFSLIGSNIVNLPEVVLSVGREKALKLSNGMARRLREMIRTTDVSTRTSANTIWLLLPKTKEEGAKVLQDRIAKLSTLSDDELPLQLKVISFSAPNELLDMDNAEIIMARLSGELTND